MSPKRITVLIGIFVGLIALVYVGAGVDQPTRDGDLSPGSRYDARLFSVYVPSGWFVVEDDTKSGGAVVLTSQKGGFQPIVSVVAEPLITEGTLKDIADAALEAEKGNMTSFRFIRQEFIPAGESFGVENVFSWANESRTETIRQRQVFVKNKKTLVFVNGLFRERDASLHEQAFQEIVSSLEFSE